jgi:hypothetical protein
VLSDTYLSNAVQERSKSVRALEPQPEVGRSGPEVVVIPPELTELVTARKLVLLAGAGISMAAGYPSARAMTETVQAHLRRELNSPTLSLTGMPFQEIASNIEAAFGRGYLLDIFLRAMSGPQGIEPTEAHLLSVHLFNKIVTTNFDTLFEEACRRQGIAYTVAKYAGDHLIAAAGEGSIICKLSGSLDHPETLLITEKDVWRAFGDNPSIWRLVLGGVVDRHVLIVGSSLRDTAVKMILSEVAGRVSGYIVSPYINEFERLQYERLGLSPITATADAFFRQLSRDAGRPRPESPREN